MDAEKTKRIERYVGLMTDIKIRLGLIESLPGFPSRPDHFPTWAGPPLNSYPAGTPVYVHYTHIETAFLHLRRICEAIAFSCVVANEHLLPPELLARIKHHKDFDYKISEVRSALKERNPSYFPEAHTPIPNWTQGVTKLEPRKDGLTQDELGRLHGRCSDMLHAKNPYRPHQDHGDYGKEINGWLLKIRGLLDDHKIMLREKKKDGPPPMDGSPNAASAAAVAELPNEMLIVALRPPAYSVYHTVWTAAGSEAEARMAAEKAKKAT